MIKTALGVFLDAHPHLVAPALKRFARLSCVLLMAKDAKPAAWPTPLVLSAHEFFHCPNRPEKVSSGACGNKLRVCAVGVKVACRETMNAVEGGV
jgi:hypothetical protein